EEVFSRPSRIEGQYPPAMSSGEVVKESGSEVAAGDVPYWCSLLPHLLTSSLRRRERLDVERDGADFLHQVLRRRLALGLGALRRRLQLRLDVGAKPARAGD